MYTIAGTGSRSLVTAHLTTHLHVAKWLDTYLEAAKTQWDDGELFVMSGMAEGFDEHLAAAALRLEIPLIAAVPNLSYGQYYWKEHSLTESDRYEEWITYTEAAFDVVYVCGTQIYVNGVHANFIRNQYMVDHANEFLVWDPTSRGTADCVKRIERAQLPYEVIPQ